MSFQPETLLDGANWLIGVTVGVTVSAVGYVLRHTVRRVRAALRQREREELQPSSSGREAIAETLTNAAYSSQSAALEAISDVSRVDDGATVRVAITPSFASP